MKIVNEMWERGFKFGKLDLYRSDATEFIIDGDTLIPLLSLWMVWERTLLSNWFVPVKRENSSLKLNSASVGGLSSTLVEKMDEMGILGNMPEDKSVEFV